MKTTTVDGARVIGFDQGAWLPEDVHHDDLTRLAGKGLIAKVVTDGPAKAA